METRARRNVDRKPLAKSLSLEVTKKQEPPKRRRKSLETGMESLVQAYYEDKFVTTKQNTDRELSAFLVDLHNNEPNLDKEMYNILRTSAEKIMTLSAAELRKHSMKDTVVRIFKISKQTQKENQKFVARLLNILAKCSRLVEYLNVENANFKDATFVEYNAISLQRTPSPGSITASDDRSNYSSEEDEEDFGMSGFIRDSAKRFSRPPTHLDEMDIERETQGKFHIDLEDVEESSIINEPTYILCRICERPVLEDLADEHTQQCVQIATHRAKASSYNVILRKLMGTAENEFNRHAGLNDDTRLLLRDLKSSVQKIIRLSLETENVRDVRLVLDELRGRLEVLEHRNLISSHTSQDILTFASQKTRLFSDVLQYYTNSNKVVGEHAPSITDYEVKKVISRGNFGQVYLATKKKTGDQYAIKVLKKQEMLLKNQAHHVKTERDILAFVNNPFVVKLYFAFTSKKYLYLVMEYLPGGDFFSMLEDIGAFEESVAKHYIAELVVALEYLHTHGIIHRDLKPDNMLIGNDGHLKLTDFGLSRIGMADVQTEVGAFKEFLSRGGDQSELTPQERRFSQVGTAGYLAPEIFMGLDHGPAADWWAVGVILYEFLLGCLPFTGDTFDEICATTFKHDIMWPRDDDGEWVVSAEGRDLIEKLLIIDPRERLGSKRGAIELKEHPFFSEIEWETLYDQPALFRPSPDQDYFETRNKTFAARNSFDLEHDKDPRSLTESSVGWGLPSEHSSETLSNIDSMSVENGGSQKNSIEIPKENEHTEKEGNGAPTIQLGSEATSKQDHFEDFGFTNYSNLGELTKEKLMMGRTRSGSFSGVDSPRDACSPCSPRKKEL